MKHFQLLLSVLLLTITASAKDDLFSVSNSVIDISNAPEFSLRDKIEIGSERMQNLLTIAQNTADEGDTEILVKAYEAFSSMLMNNGKETKLDEINRSLLRQMDLKNHLMFNCYLFMCAAYLENPDIDVKKAASTFSFKRNVELGQKFIADIPVPIESLDDYQQARYYALYGTLKVYAGSYDEAVQDFAKASRLTEKAFGKNSVEHLYFRMFEEIPPSYKGDFNAALAIAKETEALLRNVNQHFPGLNKSLKGTDFIEYSSLLSRMASYCKKLNMADAEKKYNEDALESGYITRFSSDAFAYMILPYQANCLPTFGPGLLLDRDLFAIKEAVADNYYDTGNKKEALTMYKELLGDYKKFANETRNYQKLDLKTIKVVQEPMIGLAPLCVYRFPDDPEFESLAYDCALQYKNFSLFTDNFIQHLVKMDRNQEVKEIYGMIEENVRKLDKASKEEAPAICDEIAQMKAQLLVDLDFSTYGNIINSTWQTVQEKLPKNAIAIEFMICFTSEGDKVYQANILKPTGTPHCVQLCNEKDLNAINELYTTPMAYNLIWKTIQNELTGVSEIYFSPTGLLHKIAIEYLPDEEGTIIGQTYKMFRLSSTRELTNETISPDTKKCVIYGGIQYDMESSGSGKEDEETADEVKNDRKLKGGIAYLPQTLVEMENVSKILKTKYELTGFSGVNATEESFKQLSGKAAIILHVATHGFYVPKYRKSAITKIIKNPFNSLEDQSLSCSGIMMAGANNTLAKKFMPGDDGILSAKEISRLEMGDVDLVVLSACETGLGDISDEGVFGLQRGLKKAGVNSIMMSLWEVDDEATQVFMSAFYKNLVEGQSKREAFVNAQQYLRITQDKKFDNPQFWAAFIMLDAL